MLFNQVFTKLFEELSVPLDDGLLLVSTCFLYVVVLFLQSFEYVLKLILVSQYLDDCPQEATINVLHKRLASLIIDLARVFQSENGRDDVWELVLIHLP